MIIDCDGCMVRGHACGDCVVAVLLGDPPELGADEERAIGVLASAGLVPPLRLVQATAGSDDQGGRSVTDATPTVTDDTGGSSTRAV